MCNRTCHIEEESAQKRRYVYEFEARVVYVRTQWFVQHSDAVLFALNGLHVVHVLHIIVDIASTTAIDVYFLLVAVQQRNVVYQVDGGFCVCHPLCYSSR